MSPAYPALSAQVVRRLTLDTEPYLSCDDCFDMVDGYVEAMLSDPDPDPDPDLLAMRTHLAGCAACVEETRSLILLVAEQDCLDAAAALLRIQDDPA